MNLFLSTSFTGQTLPDGTVKPEYRAELEAILDYLASKGHQAFCGLQADGWKINTATPGESFLLDLNGVKDSDLVVALVRNQTMSAGIQLELGAAYALGKQIILLWQEDDLPALYINQGLIEATKAKHATYKTLADVPQLLEKLL